MRSFLRGARESVRRLVAFASLERRPPAGGHLKLSKIGCASIFISSTPSDARGELMPAPCSVEPTGSVP